MREIVHYKLYQLNSLIQYLLMQIEKGKLRVVVMSDTHDKHFKVNIKQLPKADIFIHSGDFTKISAEGEFTRFRQFLNLLPYKHKIVIAGNHDFGLDKNFKSKKAMFQVNPEDQIRKLKEVCTYLQHESVQIQGLKIFGSPYSLQFFDWGFMHSEKDAQNLWQSIPQNIDILITHGPPYGILDYTINKHHAGCKGLLKRVMEVKPQYHIFGHIHQTYGHEVRENIHFINASSVNIGYQYVNPPQTFQISPKASNFK